jgi:hypothetical protein
LSIGASPLRAVSGYAFDFGASGITRFAGCRILVECESAAIVAINKIMIAIFTSVLLR